MSQESGHDLTRFPAQDHTRLKSVLAGLYSYLAAHLGKDVLLSFLRLLEESFPCDSRIRGSLPPESKQW